MSRRRFSSLAEVGVGQASKSSQASFGATCKRSQAMLAPAEPSKGGEREEGWWRGGGGRDSGRHEAKKEEGGERERETREQSGSRRSVIYHAPRVVRRSYPPVSSRSPILPRCLFPSTDRSSHPFPSLAHGEPSSHGDPVVREPHRDEGPGETRYERPSVPLPPKSPHTLFLNPRAVSRRSLYLLLPLRTPHRFSISPSLSLFLSSSPCRPFFFLV